MKLKTEYLPIDEVMPYENNAKEHPEEQIEQIKESIRQFGMNDPIGIWKDNVVIEGHGRLTACKQLGFEEVPVIRLDHLTDEERKAYGLIHNKTTMNSDFDFEVLSDELGEIENIDMEFYGFEWGYDEPQASYTPTDEECLDDVEHEETRYGIHYQGNKSRIADKIVNALPEGKRLVDLFGGGGAITHCAILHDKWERYLYNDINPLPTETFMNAVHGKYADERRVITREDFNRLKDTDGVVKYCWSFGNDGDSYLWSKDSEAIKCQACRIILSETPNERRLAYKDFLRLLEQGPTPVALDRLISLERVQSLHQLQSLQRLESLQRLQSLQRLESLQMLEVSNIDYRDYKYEEGDVVYCDVPYEVVGKANCKDYGCDFDSIAFYEWVKSKPYQIFFSSYEISDDSFYRVKVEDVRVLMEAKRDKATVSEYLYSNMPIK